MSRLLYFFVAVLLVSCSELSFKKSDQVQLLQNEKNAIDWRTVDDWPTFSICIKESNLQNRWDCITTTIQEHCGVFFMIDELVNFKNDTLWATLYVSNTGVLKMNFTQISDSLMNQMLQECVSSLPQMIPAIKRGQPVNCELRLPLVFKTIETHL